MKLCMDNLDQSGREVVSDLALGYEGDARSGIPMRQQIERLARWLRAGWPRVQYHYHVLAMVIGYAAAKRRSYTMELPGFSGF